jgi:hypothetical protein
MATIHAEDHDRITIRRLAAERLRAQGHVLGDRNTTPVDVIVKHIKDQTGWKGEAYALLLRWINQTLENAAPPRETRLMQAKPIRLTPQMQIAMERAKAQPPLRALASNIIDWREVGTNRR